MGRRIRPVDLSGVFRGSEAIAAGAVTRDQLRGPQFQRLFRDVFVSARTRVTHRVRCEGAALVLPADVAITGRSAAALRGTRLGFDEDRVEVIAPLETRIARRNGIDVRRTEMSPAECEPWRGVGLASPLRMGMDLLLDTPLPDAVADLDAVLRAGLVDRSALEQMVAKRHDRGIVGARRAVELADPRAESPPESRMRVLIVLDGLAPEVQYWVGEYRVDLAFPQQRLAVEYDGQWHGDLLRVGPDRERLNALQAMGWEVVFVTARLLREPKHMVRTIHAALHSRS